MIKTTQPWSRLKKKLQLTRWRLWLIGREEQHDHI